MSNLPHKFLWEVPMTEPATPSSEKRLIKNLLQNYENVGKIGRPVRNREETVVVGFGLSLFQLLELDVSKQVLTVNVWAKYTWIDQLLQWDPANYSNIREVRIPSHKIWTPDIVLYNYVDERLKELRDVMLTVDYLGRVFWSPPAIFKSNCRVGMRDFPFDYQFCNLRFASKTLFSDQMDIQFLDNRTEVDVDQYTTSNEWTLVARPGRRFVMMSEKCGRTIPDLTFFLFLKRNPAYYAYLVVFPCILLSLIPVITFWFPPHTPAKMLLGPNAFFGFLLQLKFMAKSTPFTTSTVPYLNYFYSVNLVLTSLLAFMAMIIIVLQRYSQKHPDVPEWLTKAVRYLSIPLRIEFPLDMTPSKPESNRQPSSPDHPLNNVLSLHYNKPPGSLEPFNPRIKYPIPEDGLRLRRTRADGTSYEKGTMPRAIDGPNSGRKMKNPRTTGQATMQIHTSLITLRDSLKQLMDKIAKKDELAKKARNWRLVLMTIDRVFFWAYLVIIVSTGCYFLGTRGQAPDLDELLKAHAVEYTKVNKKIAANCLLPMLQIPDYQTQV